MTVSTPPDIGFLDKAIRLRVSLTYPEVVLFQVSILLSAMARGLDYLLPPYEAVKTLTVVESAMPIWVWGVMFVLGGIIGLVGLRYDKYPIASVGHVILMLTYIGFGVGSGITVLGNEGLFGFRSPVDWLFVFAVAHWAFANASIDEWRSSKARDTVKSGAD